MPSKAIRMNKAVAAASGTQNTPKPLRIPITNVFDGSDYSAQILIGSQKVAANVILDTGSSTLAVVPSVYEAVGDTVMQPTSLAQIVQYGTGAWVGPVVDTTVQLGDPAGDSVVMPGAPIAITIVQSPDDFTGVDGIMGLAYLSLNTAFDLKAALVAQKVTPPVTFPWPYATNSFATSARQIVGLIKTPGVQQVTVDPYFADLTSAGLTMNKFAFYTLRSWVRCATTNKTSIANDPWNNGVFVLGGGEEETDLFTGDFVNVDVLHDIYYNTNLISVQVDGCPAVDAKPLQAKDSGAGSNCIIDTGTNPLVLAYDVYQAILTSLEKLNPKFIGDIRHAAKSGIASSMLNLAQWPNINFTLTGDTGQPVTLTCTPQTYWQEDFPNPGTASFQIAPGGKANSVNQSILGLPLMNNYYTVFDRSQGAGNGVIRFAPIKLPAGV